MQKLRLGVGVAACVLMAWWLAETCLVHGDLVYFEAFYRYYFVGHHPLAGFQFTEAVFAFPDFMVMTVLRALIPSPTWAILAYEFVFLLVLGFLLAKIFSRIWREEMLSWRFLLAFSAMLFLCASTPIYRHMAYVSHHHGVIQLLFILWFWQIAMLCEGEPANFSIWLALDFILGAGFAFSDMLAVPSVFLPAFAVLFWLFRSGELKSRKNYYYILSVTAVGLLSGAILKADLVHFKILRASSLDILDLNLSDSIHSAVALLTSIPELVAFNWILYSVLALVYLAIRRRERRGWRWERHFLMLAAASFAVKSVALVILGRWPNVYAMRYMQEFEYIPLLWLCLWGIPQLNLSMRATRGALAVVFAGSLAFLIFSPHKYLLLRTPPLTACLDRHARELPTPWGFANFWVARIITFTSNRQIHVNQIRLDTARYNWESADLWYTEDLYGRTIQRSTFFIPNTAKHKRAAIAKWGQPARSFQCPSPWGNLDVLIYPGGIWAAADDDSAAD